MNIASIFRAVYSIQTNTDLDAVYHVTPQTARILAREFGSTRTHTTGARERGMSELPVLIEAAQVALELLREIDRLGAKKLPRKRAAVDEELQQDGSVWARMLLNENLHTYDSKPYKKFKRRFRVPIELFDLLLRITRDSGEFSDKDKQILKTQRRSARLDLLLLAALKCLGCGHSFDTMSELNGISEETNRVFFHRYRAPPFSVAQALTSL